MKKMEFSTHLAIILQEMCKRVNANLNDIDFSNEKWYQTHMWTREKEDKFKKWLVNYLYANKEARQELLDNPRKDKRYCKKAAAFFIFNYGWKYENKKIDKKNPRVEYKFKKTQS